MSIKAVSLDESTPAQRRAFAQDFLNLELSGDESDDDIAAKIQAAQPGTSNIFVNEEDATAPQAAEAAPVAAPAAERPALASGEPAADPQYDFLGKGDPRAVIFIPISETEDGSGAKDVPVSVNGKAWLLKRGEELPVPWRVVEALRNATATIIRHRTEPEHEGEVISHNSQRFPFNFLQQPTEAEVADWTARMGAVKLGA